MTLASGALASAAIGSDARQGALLSSAEATMVAATSSTAAIVAHESLGLSHIRQERTSHRARGVPVSRPKEGS
ncbi:hypothetical protein [Kordiimonas sp.]|uniref:hypothetical protein n=1 Tax=Kordiimonas sp. TaxID=1970157 RepID=UPI003A8DAE2C